MSRRFLPVVLAGCSVALWWRCEMQTAGSSVGTGNPTEIKISFTGGSGPAALKGRVDIFAATQIPVPGYRPEPLASIPVDGAMELILRAEILAGIPDSLWPKSSASGDSLYRFNLVVAGDSQGVVLRGLDYRRRSGEFALTAPDLKAKQESGGRWLLDAAMAKLVDAGARIDPEILDPTKKHYLFLAGTNLFALADSGRFEFKSIPEGSYEMSFLSLPLQHSVGSRDSADVYGLISKLNTSRSDSIEVGDIIEVVPLPPLP